MEEKNNTKEKQVYVGTKYEITWCPGCSNFLVLAAVKKALENLIKQGYKQKNFCMCTGIGCHAKIFDYINISGVYGLHGRVIPVCLGMKLGNPNLTVLGFAGDGDTYAEGMEHFIHAGRYNSDMTMLVADNQNFALTTGQPTPTSQQGYKNKAEPLGEFNKPLNPCRLAIASGASFIARINPQNLNQSAEIIEKAIKHKGFSFVESLQDCVVFNIERNNLSKFCYTIEDNSDYKKALEIADEWNYDNIKDPKIAVGVIFQENRPILEEKWPQLKNLLDKKICWKDFKK